MDTSTPISKYGYVYDCLSAEFSQMLHTLSSYKKQVTDAKTGTKRSYYIKKINKIRPRILHVATQMKILEDKNGGTAGGADV